MFRFSIDLRHMSKVNDAELKKAGIIRDHKFQEKIIEKATTKYKKINIPSNMVPFIVEELFSGEVFLRAKQASPANRREAFNYLGKFFEHPPKRMWINHQYIELTCTGNKLRALVS